ncbi:MAG: hypothetical protein ACPG5B_12195 [Chitinophagales bacterium]
MKNYFRITILSLLFFAFVGNMQESFAQRFSLDTHIKAFGIDKVEGVGNTDASYTGETSFSVNAKFYDKNLWAFRLGAGLDKLSYQIGDSLNTNYDVLRNNITLYVGLEKHFGRGLLIPYLGVYAPITYNGNNKVIDNLTDNVVDQWKSGDIKTGFSLLAGANLKLFRVLRLGAEFNLGFEQFKEEVISPLQNQNESVKLKNLEYNTEITIGFAF